MSPTQLMLDPLLRTGAAFVCMFIYAVVCVWSAWRVRARRAVTHALSGAAKGSPLWLVAYASQTGTAESIAVETGRRLHDAGLSVTVVELNALSLTQLKQTERAFFIVSTYGEGDAPDSGALFASRVMTQSSALQHLHCAVLSLGDATYANYGGFGRMLDAWLLDNGAQPMIARIDVDRENRNALAQWQRHLEHFAGSADAPDWTAPAFECWRLAARRHLNPGSVGAPLFAIDLVPESSDLPTWESGDLVQLRLTAEMTRPREYSIASLPQEGHVRLLVRRTGSVSGWLADAAIGSRIDVRLRAHRLFRLGDNAKRPLILIGNGSGLAGLRGHIKARELVGCHENWLIYGERNAAHDALCSDELEGWYAAGVLQRLDLVYSRDGNAHRYVQDVLAVSAIVLRDWVERGAAIYVCGSLKGMGADVEASLGALLGMQQLEALRTAGRYRRDVY
jgi:sulfite reductase (NADPH) flavoprotein alpha-component